MKRLFLTLVCALVMVCCRQAQVSSPEKHISLSFRLTEEGVPQYRVERDGAPVVEWSSLGLVCNEADLSRDFHYNGVRKRSHHSQWETVWGEERMITDNHSEMLVRLTHSSGIRMQIAFRVFDDGFALRYIFPDDSLTITDELTEYCFAQQADAWSIPWRTEYYEGLWTKAPLLNTSDTLCSPVTLQMADGSYAFVHEAALTDYPAENFYMHDGALRIYLTPWLDSAACITNIKAYEPAPFVSPWRMVILAKTLPEMVASRILLCLNDPCRIEDTSWIRPMKFIGIWWGMHTKTMTWEQGPIHGATTANMERYLRFASEHGIDAVLAEGWNRGWEDWRSFSFTEPYNDWNMDYLCRLADSLGVQIVGHNETGGNAAYYESVLDEAYTYHAAHGIHAIKTGYVAPIIRTRDGLQFNKGQSGVRHYRKVIETAAKYHIAIDNHEPVMPTGLQRTYPNLMTQEGVRGQEWNAWSTDGGSPCEHVTVLPFTRIMAGPVDYTPGVFEFANPVIPGTRVHSTLMNQLGLFVCFYSPLQMACDLPENYMKHPDAFRFIEQVPCNWERSLLVDGAIGDFCIFARQGRDANDWYIGGITDDESREGMVPLSFLEPDASYTLTLWRDGDDAEWQNNPYSYEIESRTVHACDTLRVTMAPGGGFAAILRPTE